MTNSRYSISQEIQVFFCSNLCLNFFRLLLRAWLVPSYNLSKPPAFDVIYNISGALDRVEVFIIDCWLGWRTQLHTIIISLFLSCSQRRNQLRFICHNKSVKPHLLNSLQWKARCLVNSKIGHQSSYSLLILQIMGVGKREYITCVSFHTSCIQTVLQGQWGKWILVL